MSAVIRQLAECREEALDAPGASVRTSLDSSNGCPRLVQRQLRIRSGARTTVESTGAGELWYVARGSGSLACDDRVWPLTPGTAVLVPPGSHIVGGEGEGHGVLEIVAVVLPRHSQLAIDRAASGETEPPVAEVIEAHLGDSPEERTGDRTFRVLIGAHQGFTRATQFVGNIPPSRAPLHEHTYDEVVMVLEGRGVVHVDDGTWDLTAGTCIYLPPGTKHCLENNGTTTLRVLGVFCPGGTPAAKMEHAS